MKNEIKALLAAVAALVLVNLCLLYGGHRGGVFGANVPSSNIALPGIVAPASTTAAGTMSANDKTKADASNTIQVRVVTTVSLPAYTYANGSSGVGATITATSNGAIPAIDGVTLNVGDAILVHNGAALSDNGVYTVTALGDGSNPFILTRHALADSAAELAGMHVRTRLGLTHRGDVYTMALGQSSITVGTTALVFVRVGGLYADLRETFKIADDFAYGVNGTALSTTGFGTPTAGFVVSATGGTSAVTGANNTGTEIGIATLGTGTTTTGFSIGYAQGASIRVDTTSSAVFLSSKLKHTTAISDGTNTYKVRVGVELGGATPTDGVWVEADSNTDTHWQMVTRASSTGNPTTSGTTTITASQWDHITIWKDAGSTTWHAAVNAVEIGTGLSSNITTSVCFPFFSVVKSAGTSARTVDFDWYELTVFSPLGRAG